MLKLSSRTRAEYAGIPSDKTLRLAADELNRLIKLRFPGQAEMRNEPLPIEFVIDPAAGGLRVASTAAGGLRFVAPRAVEILYAVYDFAEEYLGFCFFDPGVDALTETTSALELPEGELIAECRCVLKCRGFVQEFPVTSDNYLIADWMAKNKLNYLMIWMSYYDGFDDRLKEYMVVRGIDVESGHHNFSYLIPTDKYYNDHPEYFAEINGKRIQPARGKNSLLLSEQLCTTNPGLREELVQQLLRYSQAHPEIKYVTLLPNDGFGWCECPECSKYYDKTLKGSLYSVSEHVYLANRIYQALIDYVARRLREEHSPLQLVFGAYINYCAPSPGFRLNAGSSMFLAFYWRCVNHLIDDPACPVNSRYLADLKVWCAAKNGGEVVVGDYMMGINFYLSLPLVYMEQIFSDVECYRKLQVDGFLTQFHLTHWHVYGINYYMMAQAFYGKSFERARQRLMKTIFGAQAEAGWQFFQQLRRLTESAGSCHIPYPYSLFSRTPIGAYEEGLKSAQKLAADLPECAVVQDLAVWAEYMLRFKQFFDDYQAGRAGIAEARDFRNWAHDNCGGARRLVVLDKLNMYFDQIEESIAAGKPWIHYGLDWEDEYVRKHHAGILAPGR